MYDYLKKSSILDEYSESVFDITSKIAGKDLFLQITIAVQIEMSIHCLDYAASKTYDWPTDLHFLHFLILVYYRDDIKLTR